MLTPIALLLVLGSSCLAEKLRLSCVGKVNPECTAYGSVEMPDVVQGDMVFFPDNETDFSRNAISNRIKLWPNNQIPFVFHQSYNLQEKQAVLAAMNHLMSQTCVRFVPWTGVGPVTIITKENQGCYAVVGRSLDLNGYAFVNYQSPGCLYPRGLIEHEFLHLIGLYHEQSRPDRDDYVTIHWDNIEKKPKDMKHNFDKMTASEVTTFGLPYDYQSVMHYENFDFSINPRLPTIVHKFDPEMHLGQRQTATFTDLEKVRRMYNC